MKYFMKQRLVSFGDDFDVVDESGQKRFFFDSKIGGFRPRIIVEDANANRIAQLKKKLFSFRPTYLFFRESKQEAIIFKKAFSFRKSFVINSPNSDPIVIVGSFVEHSYKFFRKQRLIAESSKKWFTAKDTYGIDIEAGEDPVLLLSAAVVIDILCHPKRDSGF